MAINKICDLLFNCLSTLSQGFEKENYLKDFGSLETNLDRVNFAHKALSKHRLFFDFLKDEKDDTEAIKLKERGNKLFALGKYKKALKIYTNTIKVAKTQETLAVAYANRSACLYKLQLYKECIVDIGKAFINNYPPEKKSKLIQRLIQAKRFEKSTKTSHEATPCIPNGQKNGKINCANRCIKVVKNENFGRHVVATRDIEIGEIICVEKPFACILDESKTLYHCHECMELCYNPVPCSSCTQTHYCSEDCREKAWNRYHKYECSILKTVTAYGMFPVLLPLKITLLALQKYYQLKTFKFDQKSFYQSDRYDEIHNLQAGTEHRSSKELFFFALIAASTYQLLQDNTDFFKNFSSSNVDDNFKEVLLLQIQICDNNVFSINECITDIQNYDSDGSVGSGIYSFSSLFNHSCCHNVLRFHYGSTIVMRAFNSIKKGEQCFVTYGPQYENEDRLTRKVFLKLKYFFECKCTPCRENWVPNVIKLPLFLELGMRSVFELDFIDINLRQGSVTMAKAILPRLISALQECEDFEPVGNAWDIKQLIYMCYCIQGNRRTLLKM